MNLACKVEVACRKGFHRPLQWAQPPCQCSPPPSSLARNSRGDTKFLARRSLVPKQSAKTACCCVLGLGGVKEGDSFFFSCGQPWSYEEVGDTKIRVP